MCPSASHVRHGFYVAPCWYRQLHYHLDYPQRTRRPTVSIPKSNTYMTTAKAKLLTLLIFILSPSELTQLQQSFRSTELSSEHKLISLSLEPPIKVWFVILLYSYQRQVMCFSEYCNTKWRRRIVLGVLYQPHTSGMRIYIKIPLNHIIHSC